MARSVGSNRRLCSGRSRGTGVAPETQGVLGYRTLAYMFSSLSTQTDHLLLVVATRTLSWEYRGYTATPFSQEQIRHRAISARAEKHNRLLKARLRILASEKVVGSSVRRQIALSFEYI